MSLPIPSNAKIQRVITEVNALGTRISTTENEIEGTQNALGQSVVDIHARITALEEKVALLTPCPETDPPAPEDPPPPEDPPAPPEEPAEIHLLGTPATLDFTSTEGAATPAAKLVLLTQSGVGVLQTPAV